MKFDQFLNIHWRWPDLDWNCYASIFANFQQVMALGYCPNFVLVNESMDFDNILRMHWLLLDLISDCYAPIVAKIQQRKGPWLSSGFRFRSNLKYESMESEQILHMHWNWPDLGWNCNASLIAKNTTQLWPLVIVKILFSLNILWTNWWNLIEFSYALILTRSKFGLLRVNFATELLPLITVRISFPLVSAQYLGNKLMEFVQVLHMHWC